MSLGNVRLEMVTTLDEAMEFKRWLGQARDGYIAVDTETSGLDCRKQDARIRLVQIGDAQTGWCIPWDTWKGLALEALNSWEGDFIYHNCFSGSERYITAEGYKSFADTVGTVQEVWDGTSWTKAEICCFGKQPVQRISFAPKGRKTKAFVDVVATPDHRWVLANRRYETTKLRVGDVVAMDAPKVSWSRESEGFLHGLVFADGTLLHKGEPRQRDGKIRHQLRLCGDKAEYLQLFEGIDNCRWTYPESYDGDPQIYLSIDENWKQVPDSRASSEYIRSFIEGWLTFDGGCGSAGRRRILSSVDKEAMEWAKEHAAVAGLIAVGFSKQPMSEGSFGSKGKWLWTLTLDEPSSMSGRFLGWTVKSIEPAGEENVYCAVVPSSKRFVLEAGILTGNCSFDRQWLEHHSDYRVPIDRTYDTMIAARILDPTGQAGLKPLATKMVDSRAFVGQRKLDEGMAENGWSWATVPVDFEPYFVYSALDVVLTSQIWDQFRPKVSKGSSLDAVYDLEMSVLDVSYKMWRRGMRVDLKYSERMRGELLAKAEKLKDWAKRNHNGLLLTSPAQMARFFQGAGVPITETTPKGSPRVDKKFLEYVTHPDSGYPVWITDVAQASLEARRCTKFAKTYFESFLENSDSDSIIRPEINTLAARTGRQSIRGVALQQLPKSDKSVRNAFLPRADDELIVSVDMDQIEARILSNISGDPNLQNAFFTADSTGGDFFTEVGKAVFNDPSFSKSDPRRGMVKSTVYGMMYGAGVKKMSETAGVPTDHMEVVVKRLETAYPGIRDMMHRIELDMASRQRYEGEAYVELKSGRRLPVDEDQLYAALNYTIQGTASELFKAAEVRIDCSEWGEYAMVPVHDEVVFSIPRDEVGDALVEIPALMQEHIEGQVPYTAGGEGGFDRWNGKIVN
jgi:DNA polymerase I